MFCVCGFNYLKCYTNVSARSRRYLQGYNVPGILPPLWVPDRELQPFPTGVELLGLRAPGVDKSIR